MDSPYDDHSLPQPTHLSHLSRNLSGLSVNSASPGATQHHPDRPFGLRISTSVSNPGSHNPSPSVAPSRKRSFNSNPPTLPSLSTTVMGAGMVSGSATPLLEEDISGRGMDLDLDYDKYDKYHETKYEKYDPDLPPNSAMTSAPQSAIPMSGSGSRGSITPGGTSPIDGGGSGSGGSCEEGNINSTSGKIGHGSGIGTGMGLMGKPMPTNNFVTKLYQMINDPKSAHFISWTEHGTSFVVSNVGEFSRSILGSHFKHNNFSSFVRQLNMYGFHKINRTPRAQRTSSDAQTWEFSHHKFLRGRPDLLDEIKRKALLEGQGGIGVGPEGVRARVELPGEVAAQLGAMREDSRRLWEALLVEKRKNERAMALLSSLWDVVGKGFPGSIPPFPVDLLDSSSDIATGDGTMNNMSTSSNNNMHNSIGMSGASSSTSPSSAHSPNIYITSPTSTATSSRFPPPPLSVLGHGHAQSSHNAFSFASPGSSPTAPEFGANIHQQFSQQSHSHSQHGHQQHPAMGRTHSFSHIQNHPGPFDSSRSGSPNGTNPSSASGERDMMDMFDEMSPVGQQGDGLNSASSSATSVNLNGSSGDGHSPDDSGMSGLSARHGDGPGDEPGSQTITGRGSTKRQRMSVSDTSSSNAHGDILSFGGMSSIGSVSSMLGGMSNSMINVGGLNGGSASSDSLLGMENGMGNMSSHSLNLSLNASLSPPDNPKRLSTRARSDSAPLYHQQHLSPSSSSPVPGTQGWGAGRPRSGSGFGNPQQHANSPYGNHMQRGLTIPSISMPRAGLNGVGGMGVQTVPSNVPGQGR